MFGIAFELLSFARDFVDVSEQAAGRFAVEARGWHERVVTLDALRPRARVELGPVVSALLRLKRGEMAATRSWVEGLFHSVIKRVARIALLCPDLLFGSKLQGALRAAVDGSAAWCSSPTPPGEGT